MKFEKEKEVHIYGIFHKNKCLYVGQSFTVQKRLYEHRRNSKMPASAKPEILHCCAESKPHLDQMWATHISGILLEKDFRDAAAVLTKGEA